MTYNNNEWHDVCITDKTDKKFFNTIASPMSTASEIKNLKRHLQQAKIVPHRYKFLDVESAVILLDGTPYDTPVDDLDKMMKELGIE